MSKIKLVIGSVLLALLLFSLAAFILPERSNEYFRERTVKLVGNGGLCSGEQVHADTSGADYILTAAHCRRLSEDSASIKVIAEDGRTLMRKIIAEDDNSDLLLLEGIPKLRGLDMAKEIYRFQKVRTFTHGRGHATYETEGMLVGEEHVEFGLFEISNETDLKMCETKLKNRVVINLSGLVCAMSVEEVVTTAMVVPGSSGGMVINGSGELVGVVSAGDGVFGYLVRLADIKNFLKNY